ncbi:MAG: hypothetical protein IPJ41_00525 [Phycisphaerales bacterium]|nr:hypothetical protein [Phycisphaerales bacterium]
MEIDDQEGIVSQPHDGVVLAVDGSIAHGHIAMNVEDLRGEVWRAGVEVDHALASAEPKRGVVPIAGNIVPALRKLVGAPYVRYELAAGSTEERGRRPTGRPEGRS